MKKKKSYMDRTNIISEGFYTKLIKYIFPIAVLRQGYKKTQLKALEKKLKGLKNQANYWETKVKRHEKDQDVAAANMRKELEKQTGVKLTTKDLQDIEDLISGK